MALSDDVKALHDPNELRRVAIQALIGLYKAASMRNLFDDLRAADSYAADVVLDEAESELDELGRLR